jgi:two-component system, NarL family, nitrate/nitrite response regulator NarL
MARKAHVQRIRLLLADDHPIVLDGIRSHLRAQPEFEIVGQAANGLEAIQKAKALLPDVVLMDITMPHLRKEVPDTKVLILTMHDSKEYIAQMLRMGARGYLLKDGSPAELVRAIKAVHAGEVVFAASVSKVLAEVMVNGRARPIEPPPSLTCREREVLTHIAEGLLNKQIADKLGIGVRTIETHRERIMRKLEIHTVAGLTKYAIAQGMTTMP